MKIKSNLREWLSLKTRNGFLKNEEVKKTELLIRNNISLSRNVDFVSSTSRFFDLIAIVAGRALDLVARGRFLILCGARDKPCKLSIVEKASV